ncbi:hypothetical protein M426DRAFT_27850 [Hypoxylon sp. CI-4A]|nr:hypothetical protein M426DRAFT_27850 [Hypoxylon sp. CI-4A]
MPDKRTCYLSALAPELIEHILLQFDSISALGNFITTCHFVHVCFKRKQHRLVFHVLSNELGPVLADARFLFLFKAPYTDTTSRRPHELIAYWDALHASGKVYRGMLHAGGKDDDGVISSEELTQLCHTLHEMNFLVQAYVTAHQYTFGCSGSPVDTASLSRSERLRILRAFYRRQIICNAWAPTKRGSEVGWAQQDVAAISNTSDHQSVPLGLFGSYEAWEWQHIDHIDYFVRRLCAALHLVSNWNGRDVDGLVIPTVLPRPPSEIDFDKLFSHAHKLTRCLRCYPRLAETALHFIFSLPPRRARQLLYAAPEYYQLSQRYFLPCLRYAWQASRFDTYPDPVMDAVTQQQEQQEEDAAGREEGSKINATVVFSKDEVHRPPFGWVDGLNTHFSNWFGEALHSEVSTTRHHTKEKAYARMDALMLWVAAGFALWDKSTVMTMKKLDELELYQTGWIVQ